jgi:hypothetical protein
VHTNMLLQVLEGILRAVSKGIETGGMEMAGRHVCVGEESIRG